MCHVDDEDCQVTPHDEDGKRSEQSFEEAQRLTMEAYSKWNLPLQKGRKKAITLLKKAMKISDFSLDAHHKLALIEYNKGNKDVAVAIWTKALKTLSDYHRLHGYTELWDKIMLDTSFVHGTSTTDVLSHKLRHDGDQLLYLAKVNISSNLPQSYQQLAKQYFEIADKVEDIQPSLVRYGNEFGFATLKKPVLQGPLGNIWGTYWLSGEELNLPNLAPGESVLQPKTEAELAEYRRQFESNRIVVVDNLLTPRALQMAYEACMRAPVWHEVKPWGYLGAYPTSGLTIAHPVFLQIGEELPELFNEIFSYFDQTEAIEKEIQNLGPDDKKSKKKTKKKNMPISTHKELNMIWAYKYDNTPISEITEDKDEEDFELTRFQYSREGIGVHADDALLNINIWLTPDTANMNPSSGGLVIYDEVAPKDWDIRAGDRAADASDQMRERWYGRSNVTVPYRQNRMVLFDSLRFHRTDSYSFKKGYRNRRINLTLLYGTRGL